MTVSALQCTMQFSFLIIIYFAFIGSSKGHCSSRQFYCKSVGCIFNDLVCDGSTDCSDGSDETEELCRFRQCRSKISSVLNILNLLDNKYIGGTRCNYGACINNQQLCNGFIDCVDGSDETEQRCRDNRQCHRNEFRCQYGACIPKILSCNGFPNCLDGSDEGNHCLDKRCQNNRFRCEYGACIWKRKLCDKVVNCFDGSDESERTCGRRPGIHIKEIELSPFFHNTSHFVLNHRNTTYISTTNELTTIKNDEKYKQFVPVSQNETEMNSIIYDYIIDVINESSGNKTENSDSFHNHNSSENSKHKNFTTSQSLPLIIEHPILVTEHILTGTETILDDDTTTVNKFKFTETKNFDDPNENITEDALKYPDVFPTSSSCPEGLCPCEHHSYFCVDCRVANITEECINLETSRCSIDVDKSVVSLDVLHCGLKFSQNIGRFKRNNEETYCAEKTVPLDTIILVGCWGSEPMVLTCTKNGLWSSSSPEINSIIKPCQFNTVNSPVCGKVPPPKRKKTNSIISERLYIHPWIVAIMVNQIYKCSGTLISRKEVLTSSGCFERGVSISPETIQVQHYTSEGIMSISNITGLYLSPYKNETVGYHEGMCILKITPVELSRDIIPACIEVADIIDGEKALTYSRPEQHREGIWRFFTQELNKNCSNLSLQECSPVKDSTDYEVCGVHTAKINTDYEATLGSPAVVNRHMDHLEKWTAVGIARNATLICKKPVAVYTLISNYFTWIQKCVDFDQC